MADLTEAEQDADYEESCDIVDGLIDRLQSDLTKAGLWSNEHEHGRIEVRAFTRRTGYPIEIDTDR